MRYAFAHVSAVSLIACLGAVPAFAQTSDATAPDTSDTTAAPAATTAPSAGMQGATRNASDLTCEELSRVDVAMVPGLLYFIAGNEHGKHGNMAAGGMDQSGSASGMDQSGAANSATDSSGAATAPDASASADTSGASGSDSTGTPPMTAMEEGSSQPIDTGPASTGTSSSGAASTDSASSGAASTGAASTAAGTASGGDQMAGMNTDAVPVMGFYPIPIKETIVACGKEPGRKAADVMKEQHDNAAQAPQASQ